jgi:hypothetical protein
VPFGRAFGALVTVEAVYVVLYSAGVLFRLRTDYVLWPVTVLFAVIWPPVFVGAAYVLLFPRLAESLREAFLRSMVVWIVIVVNVFFVIGLLTRPTETIIRSPF